LVTERKIRALRGYWSSALITSFGNPLVYLLALGIGLGSLVPAGVGGVDYLVFVAPALLAMAAVFVANEESTYPILVGFKYRPVFIAMHQTSLRGRDILLGQMVFVALRMVVTVGIYFGVIVAFGGVVSPQAPLAILVAVMTGLAVAAPISAYAATIKVDRGQLPMLFRLVFMPLFLFSGTFFPLDTLPTGLQVIGWISPLWHGAEWGRVLTYGLVEPWWLTLGHFLYLAVWIVVGLAIGLKIFDRRLEGN
jgi:lipooligosaccharide transport system permease protein